MSSKLYVKRNSEYFDSENLKEHLDFSAMGLMSYMGPTWF